MAKKILRINMSDLSANYEPVPEKWTKWGGRGLTSAITCDEVPPGCHPLGPNNKLTIAPGWVSGSPAAPSSGRTSFGGKSPLTGGIKEANSGGLSSQKIAKLGIAAIILEGMPKDGKWYSIYINKDGVIEAADQVRTQKRALEHLISLIQEKAGGEQPLRIVVFHSNVPETAQSLLDDIKKTLFYLAELSPVIGTHVGPGTLATACMHGM